MYIIIIIITLRYAENSKLFPHHGESLHHIDSMLQKMINVLHVLLIWISGGFGSSFVVNASLPIQSLRKMGPVTKIFFLGPVGSVWLKIRRVPGSLGILLWIVLFTLYSNIQTNSTVLQRDDRACQVYFFIVPFGLKFVWWNIRVINSGRNL